MSKYPRYQDYVIKDGRLIGEFDEMYRDFADPWHQSTREAFASEKAVGVNLLLRARHETAKRRVVEIGTGHGHFASRIRKAGFDVLGIDISTTAIRRAKELHPDVSFAVGDILDLELVRSFDPAVIVLAEVTWYTLEKIKPFLAFCRRELPHTWILHLLTVYPPGHQTYGREFFTDLDGIKRFFGMYYLESGVADSAALGARTWFLGTWLEGDLELWSAREHETR